MNWLFALLGALGITSLALAKDPSFAQKREEAARSIYRLVAPDTIEWTTGCTYRGVFDNKKFPAELVQNTLMMQAEGVSFFLPETDIWYVDDSIDDHFCQRVCLAKCPTEEAERKQLFAKLREEYKGRATLWERDIKKFDVPQDFQGVRDQYFNAARVNYEVSMMKLAYYISGDAADLRKPLSGTNQNDQCLRFIDLLAEQDLAKKVNRYRSLVKDSCQNLAAEPKKTCISNSEILTQSMTSPRKADLEIVHFAWANCLVDQFPFPETLEIDPLFKSIKSVDCEE